MKKTHVLLLLNSMSRTGAPKIALDVFATLRDKLSVHTVSREAGPLSIAFGKLGPVSVISRASIRTRAMAPISKAGVRLANWRNKPDLVYVNSVTALPLLRSIGLAGERVLLHVHELDSYLSVAERNDRDLLVNVPSRYIAVSEAVRQALTRRGVNPDSISVIPAFTRNESRDDAGPAPRKPAGAPFVVGGSGLPVWHKGTMLFLQMVAEITRRLGEGKTRFVWVGVNDSPESESFRETARALRVDHLVEFVPLTPDPLEYYKQFDIFALTSWEDSCPIVVLENMMLGKPVVCFADSGGAVEELADTGVAVPGFSPILMADEIIKLMDNPEQRKQLGDAARIRVLKNFTAEKLIPRIYDEIVRVADGGGRKR